jgi:hypothetical protein
MAHEDAAAGARNAADAVDCADAVAPILQHDRELLAPVQLGLTLADTRDVALGLEDLGDVLLEVARRHHRLLVARQGRVTDAGEHIGNGIGHHGVTSLPW